MRVTLLILLLLTASAPRAQVTDTVQANADTLINPWTFFRRDNPGGLAYYFMRESKPGYPDVPAHWGQQDFPSRDSVRRMYPRHRPIAIANISTASLSSLLKPFAHKDLVLEKEGVRLTFVDEEWVVLRTLEPAKGETQPAGHWQPIRVLSVNGGHKLISMGMHGFLVPLRNGSWVYFYNTYPEVISLRDRPDSVQQWLAHYSYPGGIPVKVKGKHGLQTAEGRVLIPVKYDTLFANGYYYVALRGNAVELFYRNGEPHALRNVRALFNGRWRTSALLDTGAVWLDHYGNPTDLTPMYVAGCGYQAYYRHERIAREKDGLVQYSLYRNQGSNDTSLTRKLLTADPQVDSLHFISGGLMFTDHGMDAPYRWPHDVYVARFRDGKQAIVRFNEGKMKLLTQAAVQSFRIVGSGILRFDSPEGTGLYPFQDAPHYHTLSEFRNGFAEFTLIYGSRGWVALDGKEYPAQ